MMPTIELVSLLSNDLPSVPRLSTFKWIAERNLVSHRSLFQSQLDRTCGMIFHLGDTALHPDCDHDDWKGWWASELIAWEKDPKRKSTTGGSRVIDRCSIGDEWSTRFRFRDEVLPELAVLIDALIAASPIATVWLMTDFEFGPDAVVQFKPQTPERFFESHCVGTLRWNSCYVISRPRTSN
jgi:hypothetical protein